VKTANLTLTIGGTAVVDPLAIVGCNASTNTACKLADVEREKGFSGYAFTAVGGPADQEATWTATNLPSWLQLTANGILTTKPAASPVPADAQCGSNDFFVTATKGNVSVTNKFRIVVAGSALHACP